MTYFLPGPVSCGLHAPATSRGLPTEPSHPPLRGHAGIPWDSKARDWQGIAASGLVRTTLSLDLTFWLGGGPRSTCCSWG